MAYRTPFWAAPKQDTGWGLIYRLNLLLGKIENAVEAGSLDKWNLFLDRIYANILFKNPAEIIKDEKGRILDITFSPEDTKIFFKFNEQIQKLKNDINKIISNPTLTKEYKREQIHKYKENLYNLLFKKDVWIRKKMFELKLYLQQVEHDPRKAIYGG